MCIRDRSYIAGCIANALLNREITVKMTNFNTIIDDMFPLEDKTEYINALALSLIHILHQQVEKLYMCPMELNLFVLKTFIMMV